MSRYGRYNYKIRQDMGEIHEALYLLYKKYENGIHSINNKINLGG